MKSARFCGATLISKTRQFRDDNPHAPRERVLAALDFQPPDIVPLEYHASPSGSFEHGERLHQLWERHPQDFGVTSAFSHARPEPRWVDAKRTLLRNPPR